MTHFSAQKLHSLFAAVPREAPLAIAVSGGGDSMALLHLLLNWRGSPQGLVALTVDHALREGSAAEARKVKAWCEDLGVEHHTLKWRHGPLTSGLQAKARAARYELMGRWCEGHSLGTLLTAHTLDDQAETVAMRARRTQSPRALAAIWPKVEREGLSLQRPLLSVTRQALRAYLTTQKQAWLDDPSNDNPAFERVRLRREKPSPALARTAQAAQRKVEALDEKAKAWCARHLTVAAPGLLTFAPSAFVRLSPALADAVLLLLLRSAGGKAPEAARRAGLIAWLQAKEEEAAAPRRTLGGALFARRKRMVLLAREPARIDATPVKLSPGKPVIWDGRFEVRGPKGSTIVSSAAHKTLIAHDDIPAFVRAGWPLVMRGDKLLASPMQQNHAGAMITFIMK